MQVQLQNGTYVPIDIVLKDVSNLTLKVNSDGSVRMTAPTGTEERALRTFAERHRVWLERRLSERVNHDPAGTIRLEGNVLLLEHMQTERKSGVEYSSGRIVVSGCSDTARQKAFDVWWRSRVIAVCSQYLAKWYPVLAKRGYTKPEISVRKMKSVWGSCTPKTGRIRFNYYLLCAPRAEIEYVVLHELAHLAFPNHGRRFRAFMTEHMPDWDERRKKLNQYARFIGSF